MTYVLAECFPFMLKGFWPAILAMLVIFAVSVARDNRLYRHRRAVVGAALAFSAVACFATAMLDSSSGNNLLVRDVVAGVFVGILAPLTTAVSLHLLSRIDPLLRVFLSVLFGLAILVVSPLLLLFVHCTSGDCL